MCKEQHAIKCKKKYFLWSLVKSGIIKMLQTVTNSFQQDCNVFFIYHQNAICIDFCNKQVVSTVLLKN